MDIVIIGNGAAGMNAALDVRKRHPDWSITLISEESDHFFSRTALMWIHSGQLSHADTEPLERDVYARLNFRRVRARATGLDTTAKKVLLAGGLEPVPYDRLLVACGSRPRPTPFWSGYGELAGVGHFVTHQDLAWYEKEVHGGPSLAGGPPNAEAHLAATTEDSPYQFRPVAAEKRGRLAKEVAVIGGGLIGIEAVEVAHAAGLHPHFLIREEWFWPMALSKAESTWIAARMAEHGVQVHLEHEIEGLNGADGLVTGVKTNRGDIPADCVVIAIGVVPNTEWLGDAVERDKFGGIVVDEGLRTSAEGVFAAGDCASVRWFNGVQRPEQLWYTARDQGKLAACALMGDAVTYKRGSFYNSAKLFDIEWTQAGLVGFDLEDQEETYLEEQGAVRSTIRVVHRRGEVIGFNLLGRRYDHTVLIRWINERRSPDWVLEHLHEASFDTEFVPALSIAQGGR
ncbi:MAG: FAD-dependent oxidoreductase [Deltaproteobacteria bacterium]|nr:MAG: FAD-dependent oxidoreductase [Deltaproteobacteria bacterium]